ncbi:unnamed protein product [Echinostoma caproni]|uniref:Uncharacterized protein n=1 Tax=Echinostoma caproni TaxID=27848 RepID=A0A3P8L559_9TREM|nr:unnamed protein product [Echinostoma caproni]
MLDVTHTVHYLNYYSQRLSSIAEASRFPVAPDSREPLSQLEAERVERQKKLAQLEADMEAVSERTKKQEEMERELSQRMAQLNEQLTIQLAAYEKDRRQFDEDRALWEAENRDALDLIRSSMDKLDLKEKARTKRKGLF